jgi:Cu+-exporting ATPase
VPQAQDSTTEPGCGVTATVEGQTVAVGRLDWVQQQTRINSHSSASSSTATSDTNSNSSDDRSQDADGGSSIGSGMSGQSVVYVGLQGQGVLGALGFSDTLRPDSQYVVQQLHSRGIRVVVLSGTFSSVVCVQSAFICLLHMPDRQAPLTAVCLLAQSQVESCGNANTKHLM